VAHAGDGGQVVTRTKRARPVDEMMSRKVDLRTLKQPGTELDLHEKLALDLAREFEREIDLDYVSISWKSQERAQEFFNAHGFEATLDHMISLRFANDQKK
jgi:hypothetical protein